MGNGKSSRARKSTKGRPWEERFSGVPFAALHSQAFIALTKVERSLLFEFMAQYTGRNNGTLLCSVKRLGPRGFTSSDTLHRAKKVLLAAGFIYETVAGHRPNTASLYALCWRPLDPSDRYDAYVAIGFNERGYNAYKKVSAQMIDTYRESLLRRKIVSSSDGEAQAITAPSDGLTMTFLTPIRGTVDGVFH